MLTRTYPDLKMLGVPKSPADRFRGRSIHPQNGSGALDEINQQIRDNAVLLLVKMIVGIVC